MAKIEANAANPVIDMAVISSDAPWLLDFSRISMSPSSPATMTSRGGQKLGENWARLPLRQFHCLSFDLVQINSGRISCPLNLPAESLYQTSPHPGPLLFMLSRPLATKATTRKRSTTLAPRLMTSSPLPFFSTCRLMNQKKSLQPQ